jgi:hypothetical protein
MGHASAPPLTHHDILALAAPFVRRGRAVDLAASRREQRRVAFAPPPGVALPPGVADDRLELEVLPSGTLRLTRTLRHEAGVQAVLRAQGQDAPAMLAGVDAVPAAHAFEQGPGWVLARSYAVDPLRGSGPPTLTLACAELLACAAPNTDNGHGADDDADDRARDRAGSSPADGPRLRLTMDLPLARRAAADLTLETLPARAPAPGARPVAAALPQDFLAVLGWRWTRLVPYGAGWTTRLRMRGSAAERTRQGETALRRAGQHLAQSLALSPQGWHARHRAARWGAFFRRGIPTFTALGLVGMALGSSQLDLPLSTAAWVALYHVPTLIVAGSFMLQELPRFEIPPWPRVPSAPGWFGGG